MSVFEMDAAYAEARAELIAGALQFLTAVYVESGEAESDEPLPRPIEVEAVGAVQPAFVGKETVLEAIVLCEDGSTMAVRGYRYHDRGNFNNPPEGWSEYGRLP
jgi:hypothetical protein